MPSFRDPPPKGCVPWRSWVGSLERLGVLLDVTLHLSGTSLSGKMASTGHFRNARSAINALIRIDDQHVVCLVEAVPDTRPHRHRPRSNARFRCDGSWVFSTPEDKNAGNPHVRCPVAVACCKRKHATRNGSHVAEFEAKSANGRRGDQFGQNLGQLDQGTIQEPTLVLGAGVEQCTQLVERRRLGLCWIVIIQEKVGDGQAEGLAMRSRVWMDGVLIPFSRGPI